MDPVGDKKKKVGADSLLLIYNILIVMSPLPRYLHTRCCEEEDHISNLDDVDYKSNLEEAVLSCRRNLKDFAFRQGVRSVRTMFPWSQLKKIEDDLWPSDPVHMCDRGYTALADLVLSAVQQNGGLDLNPNSGRGGRSSSGGDGRGSGAVGGGGRLGATPYRGAPRGRPEDVAAAAEAEAGQPGPTTRAD